MFKFQETKDYIYKHFFTKELEKEIVDIFWLKFDFHFKRLKSQAYEGENPIFYEAVEYADKDIYELYENKFGMLWDQTHVSKATDNKMIRDYLERALEFFLESADLRDAIDEITSDMTDKLKNRLYESGEIDLEGDLTMKKKPTYTDEKMGRIPERMRIGILEYLNNGRPMGSFLTSLFANDLFKAVARADDENLTLLRDYVTWIHCNVHADAYGSYEKVEKWAKDLRGES